MNKPNEFVYDKIQNFGMPMPDIPVTLMPSFSQCYEDIIMDSVVRAHVRTYGHKNFVFVEIGANHPVATSSSYLFKTKYNTRSILVEANPLLIPDLKKFRPDDIVIHAAVVDNSNPTVDFYISKNNETSSLDSRFVNVRTPGISKVIRVPTIRINQVMELALVQSDNIILSIDVEAYDLPILKDIDFNQYNPYLILIEPSEDYQPGSIQDIISFMNSVSYSLLSETQVNLLFRKNT